MKKKQPPIRSVKLPSGTRIVPKMIQKPDGTYEISNPDLHKLLTKMSGMPREVPEKPTEDLEDQESTD